MILESGEEVTMESIEAIKASVDRKDTTAILMAIDQLHPADITQILYEFNSEDSKYIISLLPYSIGSEIITNLDPETRRKFLKQYNSEEFVSFIPSMDSDDAADILNEQPVRFREEVLAKLTDREMASYLIELLRYEDDCAGGLMAKEIIKANANWTVVRTIEEIRRQAENVEKIYSVYVVDDEDILLGRVSLKKIILSKGQTLIKDIFEPEIVFIESYRDQNEVAEIMQRYDLESVPVVNVEGKLLGRITIDDVVDVITEQAEEEINYMAGISETVEEDESIWLSAKSRLPWLLIGMLGGLMGAKFAGLFEWQIRLVPAMAFFIPLITATGGNAGIQASTVMIQSLGSRSFNSLSFLQKLGKTLLIALVNGSVISFTVWALSILMGEKMELAATVSAAIFSVTILASVMGTITPFILHKYDINPAIASGPFITTANDLLGLAVYFGVAAAML
ncbi:MAG TPA: magnesium transporter [Catalimonadaceae bacterium]|nr:magnesium transporter [Catalimonadaceae bacterium]